MNTKNKIFDKNEKVVEHIKLLNGFSGYIQFSNKKIAHEDIFYNTSIDLKNEKGFICEAHFCDDKNSICIRQINNLWYMSVSDISNLEKEDIKIYKSIGIDGFKKNIKLAQIWEEKEDEMCENFKVKRLQKLVFAGFTDEEGEKNDNSTI